MTTRVTTKSNRSARITVDQATQLSGALAEKLAQRIGAIGIESAVAVGLCEPPVGFARPPAWALAAARIASQSWATIMRTEDGPGPVGADQVGALVGMASTWGALLATPSPEIQELEKQQPALSALRARFAEISRPQLALAEKIGELSAKAPFTSLERREFAQGQYVGASEVVDSTGELTDESTVRGDVCFYLWLFWPDLLIFESITDLQKFFDEFSPCDVTRKNLEKICGEIGLRFKGRGRPKNPTGSAKCVGIKKVDSRVKRGGANSQRRKRIPD